MKVYGQIKLVYPVRMDKVLADLAESYRKNFWETMGKLCKNPGANGLNLESLHANNLYSIRVQEKYRVILYRDANEPNTYMPIYAGNHDESYDWANTHFRISPQTKAITYMLVRKESSKPATAQTKGQDIFCRVSDADMRELGVPDYVIQHVHQLTQLDDFYRMKTDLSANIYDALECLLNELPKDEIKDLLGITACAADEHTTLLEAAQTAGNRQHYMTITNDADLLTAMAASLEEWRVYLHPTQRRAVERHYKGSARVLGVAGTGKTVVAMHRAKFLAASMQPGGKLLFTTFTKNLATDIEHNLQKICSAEEMAHIEVKNLDSWALGYLYRHKGRLTINTDTAHSDKNWRTALDKVLRRGVELPVREPVFYREEWRQVIMALSAMEPAAARKEYAVMARRDGRRQRLDRKQRLAVWEVMAEYAKLVQKEQQYDYDALRYECRKYVQQESQPLYKHIIVDEGQDFSMAAYRLLRAMAGAPHSDDLFIVGDAHQRIYQNKPILSHCGIYIQGNSTILRVNYRTTQEIHLEALGFLHDLKFDDMDNNGELSSEMLDERTISLSHGQPPELRKYPDAEQEYKFIINECQRLMRHGVPSQDICLVARTGEQLRQFKHFMKKQAAVPMLYELDAKGEAADDRQQEGIRLATMHRVKGLEFAYVFVIDLNAGVMPSPAVLRQGEEMAEVIKGEKCLLYVAMTRARQGVYLLCSGTPSPFIGV